MLRLRLLALVATAVAVAGPLAAQGPNQARPAVGGLDLAGMDRSVQPGDDFFAYANGTWLKQTEIPADRSPGAPARC